MVTIKITKKRHVQDQRTPAPLVDAIEPPKMVPLHSSKLMVKTCTFCERPYHHPCNGEDSTCQNAIWRKKNLAGANQ